MSNQATALQHNTNIGNAAGLEGNLQRASNQAKLNALLSEIDLKEQQVQRCRRKQWVLEAATSANSSPTRPLQPGATRSSQDQALAKLMNDRDIAAMKARSNQAPDLRAMLKMMGVDESWLTKDPKAATVAHRWPPKRRSHSRVRWVHVVHGLLPGGAGSAMTELLLLVPSGACHLR